MASPDEIAVFHEVVQAGGFSAAARRLELNPSTVSKTVGRLEERLGASLFVRTASSVRLTEAGRLYHERCRPILEALQEAQDEVAQLQGRASGTLRVAIADGVGRHALVPALRGFLKANPGLRVELIGLDGEPSPGVDGVDVAVRIARPADPALVARRVATNRKVVTASPAYLERCGTPSSPYELKDHDCLSLLEAPEYNRWAFEVNGRRLELALSGHFAGNTIEGLRDAALAGLGVMRTSQLTVRRALESGELVRLLEDYELPHGGGVYAVFQDRAEVPRRVRAFVDFLVGVLGD
ncbi:MAG: LysR family transcriptional regulator [Deltaproteobacteria bacterium]|nr:LysR family transcriptional regulator [Deltaproteobacteria bacterium]